ncbi:MAG TPA: VIT1/CCC1 transporter family protein [Methylomirabilota bacterium]|nr:VIT1/CCC1 transporter family protein [Methylomirabilota bacterium]
MTRPRTESKTDANLLVALAGEADANRRYLAYGIKALNEGRADIAQLFFEAAGAETIHALNHLTTMGAVGTTRENLERAATGEVEEIEIVLPRMIRDAEEDGRPDAAASFRLALERERHHRDMFKAALAQFDRVVGSRGAPGVLDARSPADSVASTTRAGAPVVAPGANRGGDGGGASTPPSFTSRGGIPTATHDPGSAGIPAATHEPAPSGRRQHISELQTESSRIERLSSIREIVFGAQDALVSTFAVVAGLAAAGLGHLVVLLGGLVSAVAGVLAMSIGTFLASRAQRQLYETELAREQREIREHPGEEIAELMAALVGRGMARADAIEVARRIARHPNLLLDTLGIFELGLAPQRLGTPVRDAFVMAMAFGVASLVPLLPFVLGQVLPALAVSGGLTLVALFIVGIVKARVAGVSAVRSGLEVAVLAAGSGALSFGLGRLASLLLGVEVR